MIELFDHAFQIADAIAVRVAEGSRVNLINDSAAQPITHARRLTKPVVQIKRRGARFVPPMNAGSKADARARTKAA